MVNQRGRHDVLNVTQSQGLTFNNRSLNLKVFLARKKLPATARIEPGPRYLPKAALKEFAEFWT